MEIINNVDKILKDDLSTEIAKGSKLSIVAAYFFDLYLSRTKKEIEKKSMSCDLFLQHLLIPIRNSKKNKLILMYYFAQDNRDLGAF